jgi:uncharacterized protein
MNLKIYLSIVLIWITICVHAQSDSLYIALIAKPKKDEVWLRWAPANPIVWRYGNQHGYLVERFTLRPDGEIDNPLGEMLTSTPLKHYSEQELAKLSESIPEASVIQEVLFGESSRTPAPTSSDPRSALARNREMENSFGMALLMCDQSTTVAQATGLFLVDKSAVKGKRYIYRVSIAAKTNPSVQPGISIQSITDEKPLMQITDLKILFGNRKATLAWPTLLHRGIYSAYYIEKSTDGKIFKRISNLPFVHMNDKLSEERANLVDSLENNTQKYYYRIIGISPFGEVGQPSNVVSGVGKDDLTGILIIREAAVQGKNNVNISWEFPTNMEKRISSFVVTRSAVIDGPYQNLPAKIKPTQRKFTDVTTANYNYYRVKALDKAGAMLCQSFPYYVLIADTIPPSTPTGITGKISKEGLVTLQWNKNSEPDLLGYRVFYANNPKHQFTETTTDILVSSSFTDSVSLEVLNKAIYYSVASVDKNYNPSIYSKPIKLIRPDLITPVAPAFTKTGLKNGGIYLEWINSVSEDIKKHVLQRQESGDTTKVLVTEMPSSESKTSFIDTKATIGKSFLYTLTAIDSAGNKSESVTGKIRFETGFRPSVTNFQSIIDRDNVSITLKWKSPTPALRYLVYRKVNDLPYILYQTTSDGAEIFIDKNLPINNTYSYQVQAVYEKGVRSMLSEELAIKF